MANQFREDLYRIYRIGTFWNTTGDTAEHFNQFLFAGIGKKTVMSDLREIFWNNMHEKTSDKFFGC